MEVIQGLIAENRMGSWISKAAPSLLKCPERCLGSQLARMRLPGVETGGIFRKKKKQKRMRFYGFFHLWCNIFLSGDTARLWAMALQAEASLMLILSLAFASQGRYCMFQQSLGVLLKSHQVIKSNFEAANEAEIWYNITRVNWAIITFLVSYFLLTTN